MLALKYILSILLLLSSCAFGQRKDLSERDGSDWQLSSDSFKIGYVSGYITAMDNAYGSTLMLCASDSRGAGADDAEPKGEDKNTDGSWKYKTYEAFQTAHEQWSVRRTLAEYCNALAHSFNFEKITVGQVINGVDAFYKDFRNTQLPTLGAMRIVRDQINDRSNDDIEKELVSWRQCHADSSKCRTPANSNETAPATKPTSTK